MCWDKNNVPQMARCFFCPFLLRIFSLSFLGFRLAMPCLWEAHIRGKNSVSWQPDFIPRIWASPFFLNPLLRHGVEGLEKKSIRGNWPQTAFEGLAKPNISLCLPLLLVGANNHKNISKSLIWIYFLIATKPCLW